MGPLLPLLGKLAPQALGALEKMSPLANFIKPPGQGDIQDPHSQHKPKHTEIL